MQWAESGLHTIPPPPPGTLGSPTPLPVTSKAERVPLSLGLILRFLLRILVSRSKFVLSHRIPGSMEDMALGEYREIKDQQSRMSLHMPQPMLLELRWI